MALQSSLWAEMMKLSGCNLQMGYKTKLLKRGEAGQQCKKHTPIGFSRKYTIKFVLAVRNKKII